MPELWLVALALAGGGGVGALIVTMANRKKTQAETDRTEAETDHIGAETFRIVDEVARTAIANLRAELAEARTATSHLEQRLELALGEVATVRESLAAETAARHLAERATLARDQHIDLLEQHIINGFPPPPPTRPDFNAHIN
ncbi:MAG: hypothetical protein Q8M17_10505 [Actinomycetota bacterium]|nr:hypothetical protein [Actinomycetota bacterium]